MEDEVTTAAGLKTEVRRLRTRLSQQEEALLAAEQRANASEARFDRLLSVVPVAVIVSNAEGRIRHVNAEALRLAGAEEAGDVEGHSVFDFVHPDDVGAVRAKQEHLWKRPEEKTVRGEFRVVRCDGQAVLVEAAAMEVTYDGEAALLNTVHALNGIARSEAEHQFREAREKAEALAQLRSAILNNVTHEVRTPLTVIVGFTSILRRGVAEGYERFVDLIERSGNRLMLMLDTILDLAQLEAGSLDVSPEQVDAVEVVRKAVVVIQPQAEEKDLDMTVSFAQERLHACLDHRILKRVLLNLLDNAIKFTDEGHIHVLAEADDAQLYIHIEDTGVGIDERYLAQVFDEFSQESTGLERTHQGSGLGLAVSQRLVKLIGGSIAVESNKGEGSRFTVKVPRFADKRSSS